MTKNPVPALVVSNSGSLQNGLLALLTTIPRISPLLTDEELSSALRLVESHQPALAVLDMSMPDIKEIIRRMKQLCPHIHLIVLVENAIGQKGAEELGVDSVLLKGFPAQKLVDIVEKLIDQRGCTCANQITQEGGTNAD